MTSCADLLAGLDAEQRAVAEAVRGPVCVLAGAGTGKTRAITSRIAYAVHSGAVPVSEILAVTFTTRAAAEMRTRLRELGVPGVQARTFHSAALRQLGYFYPKALGVALPRVVESKLRLVAQAAATTLHRSVAGTELRDLTGEIEWAKSTLTATTAYPAAAARAGRQPPLPAAEVAAVAAAYEEIKSDAGVVDFEDLLLLAAGVIADNRHVAAEVRGRYRYFVVDEYQDVNPLQQQLLDAWLGDRDDLCVVGDAGQTIYTFTGARSSYLLHFPQRFPEAIVVRLVRDYRSTPQVVELANTVRNRGPAGERLPLIAQRPAGPTPSYSEYPDEPTEAAAVAATCQRLVAGGMPAREIAVLYRINAQSEAYESALSEAGVPFQLRGAERFFERPEVRRALVLLRAAGRFPEDAAEPVTARPSAGADGETVLVAAVEAVLSSAGWSRTPPASRGAVRERWESVSAIVRLAAEMAATNPAADLTAFAAEMAERAAGQHAPPVDGVTLASLHAAKGLEWDAVFLVGLTDGMLPISYANTAEQIDEERRLFYVGITRARQRVALSWSLSRAPGGRRGRTPSRFLDGLRPTPAPTAGGRRPVKTSKFGGPVDGALFERLREWRREQAREQKQPAFCVFTDATLTAIAQSKPATLAELAAIGGVGSRKLEAYGPAVLQVLGDVPDPASATGR
ncbi:MAG: ATP-dependent DNA helicase UvrD2 [Frankiaceae bacterium]